ncbi:MAG TPA: phytanoyl-CoA dioxygenase [Sphingomicrobium sp.]
MNSDAPRASGALDIPSFIRDGFVRIDGAFSRETANQALAILWRDTGCDQNDPRTWTRPVVRLGHYSQPPFLAAGNSERLHDAFNQLVGRGRWCPPGAIGTFPVRFPSSADPGDVGWRIDVSFGTDNPDFLEWRVNINSRGRALLMLFLFSDVDADDAPTLLRAGSHHDIARQLAPAGEEGLTLRELAAEGFAGSAGRDEVLAVGEAGTVYLCHPFIVHSSQPHRGSTPRFMAQPPLLPREPISLHRSDDLYSPVEQAILESAKHSH